MELQSYPAIMADETSAICVRMIAEDYDRAQESADHSTCAGLWQGWTCIVLDAPLPYCLNCQNVECSC